MNRFLVLTVVVIAFITSGWASHGHVGVSSQCRNATCLVSASSSLTSIILALGLLAFLLLYRQREYAPDRQTIVGVWRRIGAFLIDFWLVLLIMSPLAALPVLISEASYTGSFEWSFARGYSRPSDSLYLLPAVFATFAALFLYHHQHGRSSRPTIGQYILGYRIAPLAGCEPRYARRVLLSFVGLCVWPISVILALREPDKAFWWDTASRTKAERVVV
jgi:hypothetical protein